ncbi:GNAT family N-acetyltransferase [Azospirillum sp. A29]|uniref:GNAT family N-acetyltransferase n=1 Tax=Azospirillum sp. A29 TaxID=3160606 RepID=UPI00366DFB03
MVPDLLQTSRLQLRRWREADLQAFARISADPVAMQYLLPIGDRTASDAFARRAEAHFEQYGFGFWAVELLSTHEFIGFVGLVNVGYDAHFTPAVEIGWRLHPDYWGYGYATEAAKRALRDGFERLDLKEIVAITVPANHRSRRVMERIGMARHEDDDFDHPRVPDGHSLKRHVLYRLPRSSS